MPQSSKATMISDPTQGIQAQQMEFVKTILKWMGITLCALLFITVVYYGLKKIHLLFKGDVTSETMLTNNSVPLDPASRDELVKAVIDALKPMYKDVLERERSSREDAQRDASRERSKRIALEEKIEQIRRDEGPTMAPLD